MKAEKMHVKLYTTCATSMLNHLEKRGEDMSVGLYFFCSGVLTVFLLRVHPQSSFT